MNSKMRAIIDHDNTPNVCHPLDDPALTKEEKVRWRKAEHANKELARTTRMMKLLKDIGPSAEWSEEDRSIWHKSIFIPAKHRHEKACQTAHFWNDPVQVTDWFASKHLGF